MIMNYRAKQEEGDTSESRKSTVNPSTSRQWANFKNPRIVRVSRTFGGKDRHSKVCTVRGLRDRRIRLSVPTAIQLYDLQDRLGLSQPSKVVDWLLDATKTEIDKLPPLQMPPGNFSHFFQPLPQLGTDRVLSSSSSSVVAEKEKWIASNDHHQQENQEELAAAAAAQIQAQNFFPTGNHQQPSFPNMLNSGGLPFMNPYYHHLEHANYLSLSQFGNHTFPIQLPEAAADHSHSQSHMINYSSAAGGSSQLYFCPSAAAAPLPSMNFPPPYMPSAGLVEGTNTAATDDDPRQVNHFQFFTSSSSQNAILPNSLMPTLHLIGGSPVKSLSLNVNHPKILHPQVTDINRRQKEEGTGS